MVARLAVALFCPPFARLEGCLEPLGLLGHERDAAQRCLVCRVCSLAYSISQQRVLWTHGRAYGVGAVAND